MRRNLVKREFPSNRAREASPFLDACREAGLYLTNRRRELIAVLVEAGEPMCIESYYDRLQAKGMPVARSTLYRLVADLLEARLIVETVGRDRRRYAPAIAG